ncbi:MAG: PLP-dependent aminotransferase family protein [Pseudomonadota bacterium]
MNHRETKLYQQVAQSIAEQIHQHIFEFGDKLPSLRQQSRKMQVSIATVQQAYNLLEDWGLIEVKPQSGFFVKLANSAPVELAEEWAEELTAPTDISVSELATSLFKQSSRTDCINLATAYPHESFLPIAKIRKIINQLNREQLGLMMRAEFAPGLLALRKQIARRMNDQGCQSSPETLVITNGCQEAISLSLRAVAKPGDTIAIESPTFVGILQVIEALGMKALEIPTHHREGISLTALEMALDQWPVKALVIVPSFNNPLGSCLPLEKRKALMSILQARDLPVIEDGLYDDLAHNGESVVPLKSFDSKGQVLYCSSISKSISPGLRIGWVCTGRYQKSVAFLKSFTSVGESTMDSQIVAEFLAGGQYTRHIKTIQQAFANQVQLFRGAIRHYFPPQTRISEPAGGYILWIGLPEPVDAEILYRNALDEGIFIVPGRLFSAHSKHHNFIRINCAVPWNDTTRNAIRRLGEMSYTRVK